MATHVFSEVHGALQREAYNPPPVATEPPPAAPEDETPSAESAVPAPAPDAPAVPDVSDAPEPESPEEEAEAEADETPAPEDPASPVPKEGLSPGIQKRFDRFTRQLRTTERKNLELETTLNALRAQNETLTQLLGQQTKPAPATPQDTDTELKEEDFPSYGAYLRAVATQEAERIAERIAEEKVQAALQKQREEAETRAALEAQQARGKQWQDSVAAAQARHEDYDEAIDAVNDVPISQDLVQGVQESPIGGELYYYLATHPTDIQRLSTLPAPALYRELGKLEAQLSPATEAIDSSPARQTPRPAAPVRSSVRPTPIRPVGGQGNTLPTVDRSKLSFKDYEALRKKEQGLA